MKSGFLKNLCMICQKWEKCLSRKSDRKKIFITNYKLLPLSSNNFFRNFKETSLDLDSTPKSIKLYI